MPAVPVLLLSQRRYATLLFETQMTIRVTKRMASRPGTLALTVSLVLLGVGAKAENWPAFRSGPAGGVGHGATPTTWDVARSVNIAWKTPIPGLAISSPIGSAGHLIALRESASAPR